MSDYDVGGDHYGDLRPILADDLDRFVHEADRHRSLTVVREDGDRDEWAETRRWMDAVRADAATTEPCAAMRTVIDRWANGSRDGQLRGTFAAIRLDEQRHHGVAAAIDELWQVRASDARDFRRIVEFARAKVTAHPSTPENIGCRCPGTGERRSDKPDGDSWEPINLTPWLQGTVKKVEPTIGLARSDGLRLLYPGKEHAVLGEMESGKSWFCLACAAVELLAGHVVTYVHFEEADPGDTIERLQAIGVPTDVLLRSFRFVGPEQPVTPVKLARLVADKPRLVILDGVNEAMSLHKWGIRDEDGAAAFRRALVKPFTQAGAATLQADHVAKNVEQRGRTAIGSVHKVNGLSGSLILLEPADPFGRGQRGRSRLFITKDRPGFLRRHGNPSKEPGKTYMGEFVVDDTQSYSPDLTVKLYAPTEMSEQQGTESGSGALADLVHEVIAGLDGQRVASERELLAQVRRAGHSARNTAVKDALDDLLAEGRLVEVRGPNNRRGYRVHPGASQDPPLEVSP
jgi:hypothetical protein